MQCQDPARRCGGGTGGQGGPSDVGDAALVGEFRVEAAIGELTEPTSGGQVLGGLREADYFHTADPRVGADHHHEHLGERTDPVGVEVGHTGGAPRLDRDTRLELIDTGWSEADHLNRLVGNLLDMTRLEAGGLVERFNAIAELGGTLRAFLTGFTAVDSFNTQARKIESQYQVLGARMDNLQTGFRAWIGQVA